MIPFKLIAMRRTNLLLGCIVLCSFGIAWATLDTTAQKASVPAPAAVAAGQKSNVKQIIFEEQKIEGKIRRPQLVLIKADQRPEFSPMVMQTMGKNKNIASFVDQTILEKTPYSGAFQFEGTKIGNFVP
jgi:hypothetical protein